MLSTVRMALVAFAVILVQQIALGVVAQTSCDSIVSSCLDKYLAPYGNNFAIDSSTINAACSAYNSSYECVAMASVTCLSYYSWMQVQNTFGNIICGSLAQDFLLVQPCADSPAFRGALEGCIPLLNPISINNPNGSPNSSAEDICNYANGLSSCALYAAQVTCNNLPEAEFIAYYYTVAYQPYYAQYTGTGCTFAQYPPLPSCASSTIFEQVFGLCDSELPFINVTAAGKIESTPAQACTFYNTLLQCYYEAGYSACSSTDAATFAATIFANYQQQLAGYYGFAGCTLEEYNPKILTSPAPVAVPCYEKVQECLWMSPYTTASPFVYINSLTIKAFCNSVFPSLRQCVAQSSCLTEPSWLSIQNSYGNIICGAGQSDFLKYSQCGANAAFPSLYASCLNVIKPNSTIDQSYYCQVVNGYSACALYAAQTTCNSFAAAEFIAYFYTAFMQPYYVQYTGTGCIAKYPTYKPCVYTSKFQAKFDACFSNVSPINQTSNGTITSTPAQACQFYQGLLQCFYVAAYASCDPTSAYAFAADWYKQYKQQTLGLYAASICQLPQASTTMCPRIISRAQWKAAKAKQAPNLLYRPVSSIVIHHTNTAGCTKMADCIKIVRQIQAFDMSNKKGAATADIGYNFLVGEDGNVYEGIGWNYMGNHTKYWNYRSYGIAIIGTFANTPPKPAAVNALKQLIQCAPYAGDLSINGYKVYGHSDLQCTDCPDGPIYAMIKSWPSWGGKKNNCLKKNRRVVKPVK